MPESLQAEATNLAEILSDTTEFKDPVFAQTADGLKRFATANEALAAKAKAVVKVALDLNEGLGEAHEKAEDEKNARTRDLKKAWDAAMDFLSTAQRLSKGEVPQQFKPCGDAVQAVLDKIEFSDKKQIAALRKQAQAFYPTESALVKEAQAWSVRAAQVVKSVKDAVAKLDTKDSVQKVHASFMLKFATKVNEAAKIVKA